VSPGLHRLRRRKKGPDSVCTRGGILAVANVRGDAWSSRCGSPGSGISAHQRGHPPSVDRSRRGHRGRRPNRALLSNDPVDSGQHEGGPRPSRRGSTSTLRSEFAAPTHGRADLVQGGLRRWTCTPDARPSSREAMKRRARGRASLGSGCAPDPQKERGQLAPRPDPELAILAPRSGPGSTVEARATSFKALRPRAAETCSPWVAIQARTATSVAARFPSQGRRARSTTESSRSTGREYGPPEQRSLRRGARGACCVERSGGRTTISFSRSASHRCEAGLGLGA
jgi:hypothetical protein